jgi:hypothetical protein
MPFSKDAKGGGTNSDGSKSRTYCSHCFVDGKFTQPDITADQMKELVKNKLKSIGIPGFIAAWFSKGIPKLERWKSIK